MFRPCLSSRLAVRQKLLLPASFPERSRPMMETVGPSVGLLLLLLPLLLAAAVTGTESPPRQLNTENILINVTAGTLSDSQLQDANYLQIKLNVSVGEEQVLVNDIPVELSGVTRLTCQALLLDRLNGSSSSSSQEALDSGESGESVSTVTRVMVSQNRLYSDSAEVVALQVFSEVIEVEGREVQQPDMCEVKILMSPDFQKLAQFTNVYPMGHSQIFRLPREKDVLVTHPPSPRRAEEQLVSHTTSQYPLKHSETTQEEVAAPGKLPETPLRMDPDLLYELRYDDDFEDHQPGRSDSIQMETPPKETASSYSALCRWVDEARERLKRFSAESLPLFFLIMCVVVIGVVGSAVIVRILDIIFPACEQKSVFHLNPAASAAAAAAAAVAAAASPDEETHTLLENMEVQVEDKEEEKKEKP